MIVYCNDRFLPKAEVNISPDDRGFLFGDGAYEVICSYHGKLFKAERHLERMDRSLRELRITRPEKGILGEIAEKLIQDNHLGDRVATIYLQITRGVAPRRHAFPDSKTPPTIYAAAAPFQHPQAKQATGAKIILVPDIRWARCDIKSIALLPNILANQEAKESGAEEAIFVRDGTITEGSHTNFCAIFDGQLVTYPQSNFILAGITREVVLDLCRELNIPTREFPIFEGDLKKADELMLVGTTVEIMPVIQVNEWKVGDGKPGPLTAKLQRAFRDCIEQS